MCQRPDEKVVFGMMKVEFVSYYSTYVIFKPYIYICISVHYLFG